MSLLAIDIGSSSCKAVVFSANGEILAQHTAAYVPHFPTNMHVSDMAVTCTQRWSIFVN